MKAKQLHRDKRGRTWTGLGQHEKQYDLKTTISHCFMESFFFGMAGEIEIVPV